MGPGKPDYRREFVVVILLVSIYSTSWGMLAPVFPLYVQSLGTSLSLTGFLMSCEGAVQILMSIPLCTLSDIKGKKNIIMIGLACLSIAPITYTLSKDPSYLFPGKVIYGLGLSAVSPVLMAHMVDVAQEMSRGKAVGLYLTGMGAGTALGQILGGYSAETLGFSQTYYVASSISIIGLLIAGKYLKKRTLPKANSVEASKLFSGFFMEAGKLIRTNRYVVIGSLAGLFMMIGFETVSDFFPLYGKSISLSPSTIGLIFGIRQAVSILIRVPLGSFLTRKGSGRAATVLGLAISSLVIFLIPGIVSVPILALVFMLDGAFFSFVLTGAVSLVATSSMEWESGKAMGIYRTAMMTGKTLGAIIFGVVSNMSGLFNAFYLNGIVLAFGTCLIAFIKIDKSRHEHSS